MISRAIPLSVHGALEILAAPAIMAAPFLLDFGQAATMVCILFGAVLLGLALQVEGPRRAVPISAHAGFDYVLAALAVVSGVVLGLSTGEWVSAVFLVGVGVAQVMLTASTRFSAPRGA
jgi:hypothetical protein